MSADAADPNVAGQLIDAHRPAVLVLNAGAKAAIRWLTAYAAAESEREALGIRFVSVLPQLTPATALGAVYVAAYAARQGADAGPAAGSPALTPEQAGRAITELVAGPGPNQDAYLLTAAGLHPLA